MMLKSIVVLGFSLTSAPFQCASDTPASQTHEETAGEALSKLAGDFEGAGNREGQVQTLRFLCSQHPKSRFAAEADVRLNELGEGGCGRPLLASASTDPSADPEVPPEADPENQPPPSEGDPETSAVSEPSAPPPLASSSPAPTPPPAPTPTPAPTPKPPPAPTPAPTPGPAPAPPPMPPPPPAPKK